MNDIGDRIVKKARLTLGSEKALEITSMIERRDYTGIPTDLFPVEYQIALRNTSFDPQALAQTKTMILNLVPREQIEADIERYLQEYYPDVMKHIKMENSMIGPLAIPPEPLVKTKTIYFFHFKTSQQQEFDPEDTQYCMPSGQIYPYKIVYHTISNEISQEGLERLKYEVSHVAGLNPNENQMLFYTELPQPSESFWTRLFGETYYGAFVRVLGYIKDYIGDATVFVSPSETGLEKISAIPLSYSDLNASGIRVKKWLTIVLDTTSTAKFENLNTRTYYGGSYPYKIFREKPTYKLICNEWFMYFSDIAFGCIKNRLLQLSGTCYLNAIVNGIILCPTTRNAALQVMRKLDMTQYTKPLNLEICEKKDSYYLFRLVYNTICAKVPIHHIVGWKDIMKEFSKLYASNTTTGVGGNVFTTLTQLLELIDPDHIIMGYQSNKFDENGKVVTEQRMPSLDLQLLVRKHGSGDFLMVEPGGKVHDALMYNGAKFVLQFSVISVGFTKCGGAHAIVGIKCDNNYIVFDSNEGAINLDWRLAGVDKGITDTFNHFIGGYHCGKIDSLRFVPVYVRESALPKYMDVPSNMLCDRLILN